MEIVVKISDEKYKHMCKYYSETDVRPKDLELAILNGTPLPKGHGRLKDVDKIEWYGCTTAFDCPHKDRECKNCDRAECSKTQVDEIPTIIEAERSKNDSR